MLRIEKQKIEDKEVTTIGIDVTKPRLAGNTLVGAAVGFFLRGIPGVIVGALIGEVATALSGENKE
ncbi:MAG: hypothetical protein FWF06_06740 [Symbiobacteriaceae bacterium]|nr:hypothetical protein [Symbiobacteriaceae bacterium]